MPSRDRAPSITFLAHADEHRLTPEQCRRIGERVQYTRTPEESKAIDLRSGPMIVISASGMATGGRVLHHLHRFLPDERSCVLFAGYQSASTRGRSLIDGADEIKLLGQYVPVRSHVAHIECLSAHADYTDAFRRRLHDHFGWDATVPDLGETARLAVRQP
jgi:metallo-beta-lactamase family protein